METRFIEKIKDMNIPFYKIGDNIMVPCCFHSDTKPSLGINFRKKKYNCLGCGAKGVGAESIEKVVRIILGEDEYFKDDIEEEKEKVNLDHLRDRLKSLGNGDKRTKIKILKNRDINSYDEPFGEYISYLQKRKINEDSWKRFEIRCGIIMNAKRIIVPMYDEYNRLISLFGRSIEKDNEIRIRKSKYADISKILFGWNHIGKFKFGVMIEGEIDCIYLQQHSIPAFAIGKKYPSDVQLTKMGKYMEKVYTAWDGDVPKDYKLKMRRRIGEYCEVEDIQLPLKKDPNKLKSEQIKEIFGKVIVPGLFQ